MARWGIAALFGIRRAPGVEDVSTASVVGFGIKLIFYCDVMIFHIIMKRLTRLVKRLRWLGEIKIQRCERFLRFVEHLVWL